MQRQLPMQMFLAVRHAFLPHERLLTWAEKNVDQSQQTSRSGKCTYWTLRNFTLDLAPEKMRKVSWKVKTLQPNYSVNSQALVLEATLTISLKKITSEVQFAERKSGILQNNVWKKILPFVLLKGNPVVASPKGQLYKQMTSNPAFTERNIQKANAYLYLLDSRPEQNSLVTYVSHSTELVRMCLACQHFEFNSADWISNNLHMISSWYLRTTGKDFIFWFSRC